MSNVCFPKEDIVMALTSQNRRLTRLSLYSFMFKYYTQHISLDYLSVCLKQDLLVMSLFQRSKKCFIL